MTVASTTSKASYNGDGVTVTFAVPFYFLANTDLLATLRAADGTESNPSVASYTGAGNPAGGSITMTAAPATGTRMVITRAAPLTQSLSLPTNTIFPAASVEQELDKLTMITQELQEQLNRCIKLAITSNSTGPTSPEPSASALIGWNAAGTNLQNYTPTSLNLLTCFYQQDISHVSFNNGSAVSAGVNFDLNGVLGLAAGTAAAPSLTNRADIDTGVYWSAANILGIAAAGALALAVTNPASSVNYLQASGSAAAAISYPSISALGAGAAVGMDYKAKGTTTTALQYNATTAETTGRHRFFLNGKSAVEITDTYWNPDAIYQGTYSGSIVLSSGFGTSALTTDMICGFISVESPYYNQVGKNGLAVDGLSLMLGAKGASGVIHFLNNGLVGHVSIASPANAGGADVYGSPNILWLKGSQQGAGETPTIFTNGETNVGLKFYVGSGTGSITFLGNNTNASLLQLRPVSTSAIQGFRMTASATGNAPVMDVEAFNGFTSSDTNLGMNLSTKGTGTFAVYTNASAQKQFEVTHTGSAVNYVSVTGAATTFGPSLQALGTDTNIGLTVKAKGSSAITLQNNSATQAQVSGPASAVNYILIGGNATGNQPAISAQGEATVGLKLYTSGTGNIDFFTDNLSVRALQLVRTASGVDYLTITPGATGAPGTVGISVAGTDADINLNLTAKGAGLVKYAGNEVATKANNLGVFAATTSLQLLGVISDETGTGSLVFATSPVLVTPTLGVASATSLAVTGAGAPAIGIYTSAANTLDLSARSLQALSLTNPASSVNYFTMTGAATGISPTIAVASGTDTNVGIIYATKGTGTHTFQTQSVTNFQVSGQASAVNYVSISAGATGTDPSISTQGSDAARGLKLYTSGTGGIIFQSDNTSTTLFQMIRTASSVNFLTSTPGATGNGPTLAAAGETNVDLVLAAKGTGMLKMGTSGMTVANGTVATAMTNLGPTGSHTTIQKWLQIKDSAGTTLYIPCF
jgi:hypothetical protein